MSKGKPGVGIGTTDPASPEGPLAKGNVFSKAVYHPLLGTFLTSVRRSGGRR